MTQKKDLPFDRKELQPSARERIKIEPVPYSYRPPEERIGDWNECRIPMTPEQAMAEATRCIHCPDPPCEKACPINNPISEALWHIEQGDFLTAAALYKSSNTLPAICGRVCPAELTCASGCVLANQGKGINTRGLELFVADYQRASGHHWLPEIAAPTGKKVGVIGAGPAGLTVAEVLARLGHEVVVYEAWPYPGGLLVYGIPTFKLEKDIVFWKIDQLKEMGIRFVTNTRVGEKVSIDELIEMERFDAVFLGTGAGVEARMKIPGEELGRVFGSTQFLVRANLPPDMLPESLREPLTIGKRVAVIGGGDTATDCIRSALRMGADEVTCYYRRTEAEMPGSKIERQLGIEEGAIIEYLTAPVEILDQNGDGKVDSMKMIRMELGEPDSSGRRRPVPIEGSEYTVEVTDVILAIGYWPDPSISEGTKDLKTHKYGLIEVHRDTGQTSRKEIYAGGDNVTGPALVNVAIASAKVAARAIHESLMGEG